MGFPFRYNIIDFSYYELNFSDDFKIHHALNNITVAAESSGIPKLVAAIITGANTLCLFVA